MVAFDSIHRDSVNSCRLDGLVVIAWSSSIVVWMGECGSRAVSREYRKRGQLACL
jgi:hypothetical protein